MFATFRVLRVLVVLALAAAFATACVPLPPATPTPAVTAGAPANAIQQTPQILPTAPTTASVQQTPQVLPTAAVTVSVLQTPQILPTATATVESATPMNEMATLQGTVTYRERMALPAGATIEVTLEDISRADAPAVVIASQTITANGQQVPIPFSLEYDPAAIQPGMRYSVRATIRIGGQLMWTSTTVNPVLTNGAPSNNVEILVERVAQS